MFSLMLLISLRNLERRLSICCLTFFLKWFTGSLKAAWSFAFILSIWFSRMIREVVLAKYWLKWLQKATQEMLLLPVVAVIVVVDDEIRTKLVLFAGLVLFQPLAVLLRTHSCFPEPKPNRKNVNRTTVIFVFSSFRKRGNKCPISYWAVDKSLMKHGKLVPQKANFFAMQCKNLSLDEGRWQMGSLVMLEYKKTPICSTFASRLLQTMLKNGNSRSGMGILMNLDWCSFWHCHLWTKLTLLTWLRTSWTICITCKHSHGNPLSRRSTTNSKAKLLLTKNVFFFLSRSIRLHIFSSRAR